MMDRRSFLAKAATVTAAAPLIAVPVAVAAKTASASPVEQVQHHVEEIMVLLRASAPKQFNPPVDFAVVGTLIISSAFPDDYKRGDEYAKFSSHKGGWKLSRRSDAHSAKPVGA